ncbi:hypothetical protein GHX96_23225 [Salmonella enterica]|nr:hypothetical protein [Salmonella enterica]
MKHLIKIVKGEPVVSTEVIAAEFGRRHDNVMRNIRSLIESDHLGPLDFKESSFTSSQAALIRISRSAHSKQCVNLRKR